MKHALMAAVTATGEWCPEIHDVEMLLELARQADPEGCYATVLDPEIYTQYGGNRRGIPRDTPFISQPEHRVRALQDVQAALAHAWQLQASWPLPTPSQRASSPGVAIHADLRGRAETDVRSADTDHLGHGDDAGTGGEAVSGTEALIPAQLRLAI